MARDPLESLRRFEGDNLTRTTPERRPSLKLTIHAPHPHWNAYRVERIPDTLLAAVRSLSVGVLIGRWPIQVSVRTTRNHKNRVLLHRPPSMSSYDHPIAFTTYDTKDCIYNKSHMPSVSLSELSLRMAPTTGEPKKPPQSLRPCLVRPHSGIDQNQKPKKQVRFRLQGSTVAFPGVEVDEGGPVGVATTVTNSGSCSLGTTSSWNTILNRRTSSYEKRHRDRKERRKQREKRKKEKSYRQELARWSWT
ncbi:hypothetical protein SODALDRAFT_376768, partial [Sodiomyces alkalinus F11]